MTSRKDAVAPALPLVCDQATCAPAARQSSAASATRIRSPHSPQPTRDQGRERLTSAARWSPSIRLAKPIWPPGAKPGTTDGRLLPRAPADLRHEAATLGLVERYAVGPRERPSAVGALRRHFAFRQDTRLALDLHVRPELRGRGIGGSLLVHLLARARALGAEVVRSLRARWTTAPGIPWPPGIPCR